MAPQARAITAFTVATAILFALLVLAAVIRPVGAVDGETVALAICAIVVSVGVVAFAGYTVRSLDDGWALYLMQSAGVIALIDIGLIVAGLVFIAIFSEAPVYPMPIK